MPLLTCVALDVGPASADLPSCAGGVRANRNRRQHQARRRYRPSHRPPVDRPPLIRRSPEIAGDRVRGGTASSSRISLLGAELARPCDHAGASELPITLVALRRMRRMCRCP